MSAHVVSKPNIDVLVHAANLVRSLQRIEGSGMSWWIPDENGRYEGWRTLEPYRISDQPMMTCDELGQMLWDECVKSVRYRYPDDYELPGEIGEPWIEPYTFDHPRFIPTSGEVFATIDYYSYQSCEHEEWYGSEAETFCRFLRSKWCSFTPGYDQAPWGWERASMAKRATEFHSLERTVVESANSIR